MQLNFISFILPNSIAPSIYHSFLLLILSFVHKSLFPSYLSFFIFHLYFHPSFFPSPFSPSSLYTSVSSLPLCFLPSPSPSYTSFPPSFPPCFLPFPLRSLFPPSSPYTSIYPSQPSSLSSYSVPPLPLFSLFPSFPPPFDPLLSLLSLYFLSSLPILPSFPPSLPPSPLPSSLFPPSFL
jgi:hypothetical protein